jgi:hypothetical protein
VLFRSTTNQKQKENEAGPEQHFLTARNRKDMSSTPKHKPLQHPFFMRRTKSQVFRQLWDVAYTEKIREQGVKDIATPVKFEIIDLPDVVYNELELQSNECILIMPKAVTKQAATSIVPSKALSTVNEETKNNSNSNNATNNSGDEEEKETVIQAYRLPLLTPTIGHHCIDVRSLFGYTGVTTYDPGFMSTASCHSQITFIDGANGRLLHRGYSIQDLCANCDSIDLSFLLLYGELPGINDRLEHEMQITNHSMVHEKLIQVQLFLGLSFCSTHSFFCFGVLGFWDLVFRNSDCAELKHTDKKIK